MKRISFSGILEYVGINADASINNFLAFFKLSGFLVSNRLYASPTNFLARSRFCTKILADLFLSLLISSGTGCDFMALSLKKYKSHTLFYNDFNHCASVTTFRDRSYIVYYSGRRECSDSQCVIINKIFPNGEKYFRLLEPKTGNPIIFTFRDKLYLIYTKFTKELSELDRVVDRWKHCDLYACEVNPETLSTSEPILIGSKLLARCQPLILDDECIIPLYMESYKNWHGEVYKMNPDMTFEKMGNIGKDIPRWNNGNILIQPTIWHEKHFKAFARNITQKHQTWMAESLDGKIWTDPHLKPEYPNWNNSIVVFNNKGKEYVIWNNTNNYLRSDLTLAPLWHPSNVIKNFGNGSYPNAHSDENGRIHIVYTKNDYQKGSHARKSKIRYHILEVIDAQTLQ